MQVARDRLRDQTGSKSASCQGQPGSKEIIRYETWWMGVIIITVNANNTQVDFLSDCIIPNYVTIRHRGREDSTINFLHRNNHRYWRLCQTFSMKIYFTVHC